MGDIVKSARATFFDGKKWDYGQNHGGANNPNAFQGSQADCTYLVYQSNLHAGYNVPYLSTRALISNGTLSAAAAKYYEVVDAKDAKPGDTVYYPAAAQNANHVMVLTSWDSSNSTGSALGAQSTNTGLKDDIKVGEKEYWKAPALILRPKAETYVPELDLTSGPDTGIGSPRVIAAVNLLKTEGAMEGYRPGIYTDSGGVPTFGNGFALVVKGSSGYVLRSEEEIKGLLRMAGLPESKYADLPLDILKQSVNDLRSGDVEAAKARFGDGKTPSADEFSVSPFQADRLTAAFIVADVTPKLVSGLGGPDTYNALSEGEFAAIAGSTYKSPNWLKNHPDFVKAFKEGDDEAAIAAFGTSKRGLAEASAYAGNVSTSNDNLGTGHPTAGNTSGTGGHWEYPDTSYNAMGDFPAASEPVWVPDALAAVASKPTLDSSGVQGQIKPAQTIVTPSKEVFPSQPIGESLDGDLPDGTRIISSAIIFNGVTTRTDVLKAANGEVLLTATDGQTMSRDPETGIVSVQTVGSNEVIQYDPGTQTVSKWMLDGATSGPVYQGPEDEPATPIPNSTSETPANGPLPINPPSTPQLETTPAAYRTQIIDGETYALNDNGSLSRALPGHRGWVELRDSLGWGIVLDAHGDLVIELQPGDRLLSMDDGRLVISDSAGKPVDRNFEEAFTAAFYRPTSDSAPISIESATSPVADSAFDQLVDAFSAPSTVSKDSDILLASADNTFPDSALSSASDQPVAQAEIAQPAINTIAQQASLATQLSQLGFSITLRTLPGGVTLIANADGDPIGEITPGDNGVMHFSANGLTTDGANSQVSLHITPQGLPLSDSAYTAALLQPYTQGLGLVNSLMGLKNWDAQNDLNHINTVVSLYNQVDNLGGAMGSTGNNLPGDLGQWGAGLSMITALQGNDAIAQASAGAALYNTFASSAGSNLTPIPIPFVQALNLIGAIESGNTVSMLASAVAFIPGWGALASIGISVLGALFADKPPPPEGITHFEWDTQGNVTLHLDQDQSGGGAAAKNAAQGVQDVINNIVQAINAKTADTGDDVGLNPYLIPRIGFSNGVAWIETPLPNGQTFKEPLGGLDGQNMAGRLLEILVDTGAIASTWLVQTQAVQHQQLQASGASSQAIAVQMQEGSSVAGGGMGGTAHVGNAAMAIQGNATQSADFKTQSFGALVVHLAGNAGVAVSETALAEILRDTDNDGFFEKTQWVSATDTHGNPQGLLVLDFNGNGQIETRDILNLGGNVGQTGNTTDAATLASQTADQQRNNVQWLDANGDGVLDASDPAFAAIKLWVDTSQDGRMGQGESLGLAAQGILSIDLRTGQVNYTDGSSDAVTTTALQSDTDGVRATLLHVVQADGTVRQVDAGNMLEHEGYQGQVKVVVAGVEQWQEVREATFEHDAKRTGDWEGTAEQDEHRHGTGGNMEGAPTQTNATGATSLGPMLTRYTSSSVQAGDARITSDAPTAAKPQAPNAQSIFNSGDSRIQSNRPAGETQTAAALAAAAMAAARNTVRPVDVRLAALGNGPQTPQEAMRLVTLGMVQSAQSGLFGVDANSNFAGMGVLAAIGLGAVQTTTFARGNLVAGEDADSANTAQQPALQVWMAAQNLASQISVPGATMQASPTTVWSFDTQLSTVDNQEPPARAPLQFRQVDLGNFYSQPSVIQPPQDRTEVRVTAVLTKPGGYSTYTGNGSDNESGFTHWHWASDSDGAVLAYPDTQGETVVADEDQILRMGADVLLGNDRTLNASAYPDRPALQITAVGQPAHGQVSLQTVTDAQGRTTTEVLFIPDANFHGIASFGYTVTDQYGLSSDAVATLDIASLNDAPVTAGETAQGTEDMGLLFSSAQLLSNDTDADLATDGQNLSISRVGDAVNGTVSLDAAGNVRFAPAADYHGNAQFSYWVSDGAGAETPATVGLTLSGVNDAPQTTSETAQGQEDVGLVFSSAQLLANDSDPDTASDGQILTVSRVGDAQHGTASLDATGVVRFVPDLNYFGPAQFTYWVNDGAGGETPATVSLTLVSVNDVPVTVGETAQGLEDVGVVFTANQLLANDSDVDVATDGQILTIGRVGNAQHGTVALDAAGTIRFLPDANYNGPAQFSYWVNDGAGGETPATVNLTIGSVNDAPVVTPQTALATEDMGLLFSTAQLLANATDPDTTTDGQVLTVNRVGTAQNGTVWMDASGDLQFVPDANYNGPAQFTYWVKDSEGAETQATVDVIVTAVNDLPTAVGEIVNSDQGITLLFSPATLLANDTDVDIATNGQTLSLSGVSNASHGTVSLVNGQVQFVPQAGYFGVAGFNYTVSDGAGGSSTAAVVVNLAHVNQAPIAVDDALPGTAEDMPFQISFASLLVNDTDADSHNSIYGGIDDVITVDAVGSALHGTVAIVNGAVLFTPDANYHGPASFVYQVRDSSGALAQAIASFTIASVNDSPGVYGETISSDEDTTLYISSAALLLNDVPGDGGIDGQTLSVTGVFNAQNGSVSLAGDGTIQFIPSPNYYGTARFDYTVSDGSGGTGTSTVIINLTNVNDAPVATGETIQSLQDQVLNVSASALLQNESDVDNPVGQLHISRVQDGTGGTVSLSGGDVVFTPTAGFNGTATFSYWVQDPLGLESNQATATIVVAPQNSPPSAQGETVFGASEDAVFNINASVLTANDLGSFNSNTSLNLSWVGSATGGTVSLDGSGNVIFTPNANFNGNASFEYRVRDAGNQESPTVTAVIPVAAVNDNPIAVDDQFQTYRNSTMTIGYAQLTGNDQDVDQDALTVGGVRNASNGVVSVVNGAVQFVPTNGFTGNASFEYLTDDSHGGQVWATAFITVSAPPNLYPSMTLISTNFYGTGGNTPPGHFDVGTASYNVSDDGFVANFEYIGGTGVVKPQAGFTSPQPLSSLNVNFFNWNASSFTIDLNRDHALSSIETTWRLTDNEGLFNIWHFNFSMSGGAQSYMEYTGYAPPVVLALGSYPSAYIETQYSNVYFDVNQDGVSDRIAWAAPGSGVLGLDLNGDHRISDASEFAFARYLSGAQTDLEGLHAFDTNSNGRLDSEDAMWKKFGVWEDKNSDGVTQDGEYLSLDAMAITSINLASNGQSYTAPTGSAHGSDVFVAGHASFQRTDGSSGVVADAFFAYQSGTEVQAALASTADINRMAMVFNQMSNDATHSAASPLGFAPIQPEHNLLIDNYTLHELDQRNLQLV